MRRVLTMVSSSRALRSLSHVMTKVSLLSSSQGIPEPRDTLDIDTVSIGSLVAFPIDPDHEDQGKNHVSRQSDRSVYSRAVCRSILTTENQASNDAADGSAGNQNASRNRSLG